MYYVTTLISGLITLSLVEYASKTQFGSAQGTIKLRFLPRNVLSNTERTVARRVITMKVTRSRDILTRSVDTFMTSLVNHGRRSDKSLSSWNELSLAAKKHMSIYY